MHTITLHYIQAHCDNTLHIYHLYNDFYITHLINKTVQFISLIKAMLSTFVDMKLFGESHIVEIAQSTSQSTPTPNTQYKPIPLGRKRLI